MLKFKKKYFGFQRLLFALYFITLSWINIQAQNQFISVDSRSAALSDAVLTTSSENNYFGNPSLWCMADRVSAGLHYTEKYFIDELSGKSVSAILPIGKTSFGIGYSSFGFKLFNENTAGFGISRKLGEQLAAGVKLKYYYHHIDYEESGQKAVSFELGISYLLNQQLRVGLWYVDPVSSDESYSPAFYTGILYSGNDFSVSARGGWLQKTDFRLGIEYEILNRLYLRAGVYSNEYKGYSFGLGYLWKNIRIDGAFVSHPILGISPHITLLFFLNTK